MISVDIYKKLGKFILNPVFETSAKTTALLGASGSGKSATLKCIAGIIIPDRGHIINNNIVLYNRDTKTNVKIQKRNIGYMFQDYALFPNMSVRQNILCAAKNPHEADDLIERFGLGECADLRPDKLSGGQKQRTALARGLAVKPCLFLFDEPFSALDGYLKEKLHAELKRTLNELDIRSVIVTHDCDEAYKLSDEVMIIDRGRIIEKGDTKRIFVSPQKTETARITGCENIFGIKKISDNELCVPELGITLKTSERIGNAASVGIRADSIKNAAKNDINAFAVDVKCVTQARSENIVTLGTKCGELIGKTSGSLNTGYVRIEPEDILLLEEGYGGN